MKFALSKLWEAIKEAYFNIAQLMVLNLYWFVTSLTIILIPPAIASLYASVRALAAGDPDYSHKLFFKGIKQYFLKGWKWFLPNLLIPLLLANILFFVVESEIITLIVKLGNLAIIILWLWMQTFLLPFIMEQEEESWRLAIRNSLVVFVKRPAVYIVTTLFVWLFFILSLVLMMPWVVISISFIAFITISILRDTLTEMKSVEEG